MWGKIEVDRIMILMPIRSRNNINVMHWTKVRKLKQTYQLFIRNQMVLYDIKPAKEGEKFHLKLVTYNKWLIEDYDNLVGGAKQMIDACEKELFIWKDSMKFIGKPDIEQEKCLKGDEEHTMIERSPWKM